MRAKRSESGCRWDESIEDELVTGATVSESAASMRDACIRHAAASREGDRADEILEELLDQQGKVLVSESTMHIRLTRYCKCGRRWSAFVPRRGDETHRADERSVCAHCMAEHFTQPGLFGVVLH